MKFVILRQRIENGTRQHMKDVELCASLERIGKTEEWFRRWYEPDGWSVEITETLPGWYYERVLLKGPFEGFWAERGT